MTKIIEQHAILGSPNYVWEFFHYHASQRLTTFNFYIIICTLLGTGYLRTMNEASGIAAILAFIFCFITFIFWKLDVRNKQLIDIARKAMRNLESSEKRVSKKYNQNPRLLFCRVERQRKIDKGKTSFWPWRTYYGYAECFKLVFVLFFSLGLLAALNSFIHSFSENILCQLTE